MLNALKVIRQCQWYQIIKKVHSNMEKNKNLNILNTKFDSEPVYGVSDKYIRRKIKIYEDNVNTNFHGKKVPKENASYKCLSLIMLDSVIKIKKKYYPQTLLEECKFKIKNTKMENLINNDLDPSLSDDETDSDSGNEPENESEKPSKKSDNE